MDVFTKLSFTGHSRILSKIIDNLSLPEILILTSTSNSIRNLIYSRYNFKNIPIVSPEDDEAGINRDLIWKPKNRVNIEDYDLMINPNLLANVEKLEQEYVKFCEDHENKAAPFHKFKIGQCVQLNILKNQYREHEGCTTIKGVIVGWRNDFLTSQFLKKNDKKEKKFTTGSYRDRYQNVGTRTLYGYSESDAMYLHHRQAWPESIDTSKEFNEYIVLVDIDDLCKAKVEFNRLSSHQLDSKVASNKLASTWQHQIIVREYSEQKSGTDSGYAKRLWYEEDEKLKIRENDFRTEIRKVVFFEKSIQNEEYSSSRCEGTWLRNIKTIHPPLDQSDQTPEFINNYTNFHRFPRTTQNETKSPTKVRNPLNLGTKYMTKITTQVKNPLIEIYFDGFDQNLKQYKMNSLMLRTYPTHTQPHLESNIHKITPYISCFSRDLIHGCSCRCSSKKTGCFLPEVNEIKKFMKLVPLPGQIRNNAHKFTKVWYDHSLDCGKLEENFDINSAVCCEIPYCEVFKGLNVLNILFGKVLALIEQQYFDRDIHKFCKFVACIKLFLGNIINETQFKLEVDYHAGWLSSDYEEYNKLKSQWNNINASHIRQVRELPVSAVNTSLANLAKVTQALMRGGASKIGVDSSRLASEVSNIRWQVALETRELWAGFSSDFDVLFESARKMFR